MRGEARFHGSLPARIGCVRGAEKHFEQERDGVSREGLTPSAELACRSGDGLIEGAGSLDAASGRQMLQEVGA